MQNTPATSFLFYQHKGYALKRRDFCTKSTLLSIKFPISIVQPVRSAQKTTLVNRRQHAPNQTNIWPQLTVGIYARFAQNHKIGKCILLICFTSNIQFQHALNLGSKAGHSKSVSKDLFGSTSTLFFANWRKVSKRLYNKSLLLILLGVYDLLLQLYICLI